MNRTATAFCLSLFLLSLQSARAQIPFGLGGASNVTATLQTDKSVVAPGGTVNLVLTMDHAEGWNTYWLNPGTGMPTDLKWELPEGFTTGDILWPIPKVKETEFGNSHVYGGVIHLVTPLRIPENAQAGEISISLKADWLECDIKGCVPKGGEFSTSLSVGEADTVKTEVAGLVAAVEQQQPRSLDAWTVIIGGDPSTFEARLKPGAGANPDPGTIYFFEASSSPALKLENPEIARDGDTIVLTLAKENEVDSASVPGFFFAPNGWLSGDAKARALKISTDPGALPTEKTEVTETAPPAPLYTGLDAGDVARGAELYDPATKPAYVLLSGQEEKQLTLLPALGLVFIGGLLLNLMPCVFPVLGLKIMGFVSQAGEEEHKVKNHGLIFGLGVLVSMWILSGIIIALGLNWGAQLTNPVFVAGIVILLFLLGLNMAGVFEIGTSLTGVGGGLQTKKGYSGSFFSGVLTTMIATPCSGPFLGSVMGFALSQTSPIAFLIFTFFALGIASPYIVLSFFPKAIKRLPQPGPWMEHFKKGMSFALFATAAFFMGSFAKQTGYDGMSWMLFALVVFALAFWLFGTWGTPFHSKAKRYIIGYGLAIAVGALAVQMTRIATQKEAPKLAGGEEWKPWYPGVVEVNRSKKRIAWVDYTADW